jgi:hypothetical protein
MPWASKIVNEKDNKAQRTPRNEFVGWRSFAAHAVKKISAETVENNEKALK